MFHNLAIIKRSVSSCGIRWWGLESSPTTNGIVCDDERSCPAQRDRPIQVIRIVLFIGIDENQVEGCLGHQLRQEIKGRTNTYLAQMTETSCGKGRTSNLCMPGVDFQGDQLAIGRQATRQPDARISSQGPNFEDRTRTTSQGKHLQQFSLQWRNLDGWNVLSLRSSDRAKQG